VRKITSRFLIACAFILSAPHAWGCSLGYLTQEAKFPPRKATLPASEIKRIIGWREKISGYTAGFEVYIVVWQNSNAGAAEGVVKQRAVELRRLLENLDIPEQDIQEVEFRRSTEPIDGESAQEFFDTARIDIVPRCPNACCDR